MSEATITHVSDTALWVATYRAQESERPDAVFRDPLAKKLAGERGAQFAVPSVAYWIQDYARGKFRRVGDDKVKRMLGKVPFRFDSRDPLAFFGQHGWVPEHDIAILDEADRLDYTAFRSARSRTMRTRGRCVGGQAVVRHPGLGGLQR